MNIFIDTNIFLGFYSFSAGDLEELRKVAKLSTNEKINLFISDHLVNEFYRNRESVIAQAVAELEKSKVELKLPNLARTYEESVSVRRKKTEFEAQMKELKVRVFDDIKSNSLNADRVINEVFESADIHAVVKETVHEGIMRHQLRQPPGKKDSCGDAIHWEWLLQIVPDEEDLIIISNDADFESPLEQGAIDNFLHMEWEEKKKSSVSFVKLLSRFLTVDCKSNCPDWNKKSLMPEWTFLHSPQTKERNIGMRQIEGIRHLRKGKHLNWDERIQIETLQREGHSSEGIGRRLGRPARTVRREIRRGWVLHRLGKYRVEERYSAVRGQAVYEHRMHSRTAHRPVNTQLQHYLYVHIVESRESPEVVAARMKTEQLDYAVCAKTIYNLIDHGRVPGVANESLWEKRKRKQKRRSLHRERKRAVPLLHSIENRPEQVESRQEAGHWEIDLVVGGKAKGATVLLTLIERKTRKQIIRKLKNKTQAAVLRAVNGIERQMGKEAFRIVFKSITADNGSEFLDYQALERSVSGGSRTYIYYAHPYSSWERGSNENANRMIRRFIPKGCDISKFTRKHIQEIESWINNYPRKILNFETAEERFIQELAA